MKKIYKSVRVTISNIIYLLGYFKWLIKQIYQPRPIGTRFYKSNSKYIICYEIIGHTADTRPKEMIVEIKRLKRKSIK